MLISMLYDEEDVMFELDETPAYFFAHSSLQQKTPLL
jgi:hypothetical protein